MIGILLNKNPKLHVQAFLRLAIVLILLILSGYTLFKGLVDWNMICLHQMPNPDEMKCFSISCISNDCVIDTLEINMIERQKCSGSNFSAIISGRIKGYFDVVFIHLPFLIRKDLLLQDSMDIIGGYVEIESPNTIIIREGFNRNRNRPVVFNIHLMIDPIIGHGYSWTEFFFPMTTSFTNGIPYSESRHVMREIYEPRISYYQFTFLSSINRHLVFAFPIPDFQVASSDGIEWRWVFKPSSGVPISSLHVKLVDFERQRAEKGVAFRAGIFIATALSVLVGFVLQKIASMERS